MGLKFIAAVVAAALTVTTFGAAPARADNDLLKSLAIVAGAAAVGKLIYDRNQRAQYNDQPSRNSTQPQGFYRAPEQQTYRGPKSHNGYHPSVRPNSGYYNSVKPRHLPKRVDRKLLPGDCLQSIDTRNGRVRFFSQRCLEQNYQYVNRLPRECAVRFRTYNGPRAGYDARCLRDEGYQLARG